MLSFFVIFNFFCVQFFSFFLLILVLKKYIFLEVGYFTHLCENDIVCETTCGKIPYFNASVYFQNMEQIGKIDEIFGGIKSNVCFFF